MATSPRGPACPISHGMVQIGERAQKAIVALQSTARSSQSNKTNRNRYEHSAEQSHLEHKNQPASQKNKKPDIRQHNITQHNQRRRRREMLTITTSYWYIAKKRNRMSIRGRGEFKIVQDKGALFHKEKGKGKKEKERKDMHKSQRPCTHPPTQTSTPSAPYR